MNCPHQLLIHQSGTVTTTKKFVATVDRKALLDLLNSSGAGIPENAEIYFQVPGGADWSNTAIDIDAENPVRIEWSTSATTDL